MKLVLCALLPGAALVAACTIYTGDGSHHHAPDACGVGGLDGPPPVDGGFAVDAPTDASLWPDAAVDGGFFPDGGPGCEVDGGSSLDAAPQPVDGGFSPDAHEPCCPHVPDAGVLPDAPY